MFEGELHLQKSPMAKTYHPKVDDKPLLVDTKGAAK
jgi:hypothetical protein